MKYITIESEYKENPCGKEIIKLFKKNNLQVFVLRDSDNRTMKVVSDKDTLSKILEKNKFVRNGEDYKFVKKGVCSVTLSKTSPKTMILVRVFPK